MEIPILFEDEYLVIVNKPAQIPSQPTVDKRRPDTFSILKQQKAPESVFLHHRLDKDTSGVLLFSKSKLANGPLTEMFKTHQFQKIYWALTASLSKIPDQWTIENHLILRRLNAKASRMEKAESGGDYARTDFKILKKSESAFWVRAQPQTGRQHQIRVHCQQSRIPILGDALYGGASTAVPRLMLHAHSLEFIHPISRSPMRIEAPLPKDFQSLVEKMFFKT